MAEIYGSAICGMFVRRVKEYVPGGGICDGEGRSIFVVVGIVCHLILTLAHQDGFLLSHEWPLYVGDFALMAVTLIVCLAWYDPNIRPRRTPTDGAEMELL